MIVFHVSLPLFSTLSLPLSRRAKFLATAAVSVAAALLFTAIGGVLAIISVLITPFLPSFSFGPQLFTFEGMDPRFLWAPFFVTPLFGLCRMLYSSRSLIIQIIPSIILLVTGFWLSESIANVRFSDAALGIGVMWAAYFILIYYIACFWDLSVLRKKK